ncbi:transcriptional regulator family: C2H2 zinc finger [Penicillium roqueforti]|nr:transcriptional regulator family: C2H2 zinc finger [Penicillium roqueforti]KAI2735793.1 transcriptional regulator family: C2H2 zinc finger [Penicillium roqueforti]KAI2752430.1 transcriptional regulator family: C2H2 zinc finger [Penicillium roqueforti]KAI3112113.1 transcriptional regulator family: C2H2 zinc finger [Penicillium roqueforti]KAI3213774.1 transcriptional regulator family: C2H2 zinc finger [Penicillium roqueforti]
MTHASSNDHLESFPVESYGVPHSIAYAQNTPQGTLHYLEQDLPFQSSVYGLPWALNDFDLNMPITSAQANIESLTGSVRDNASPFGAENTTNSAWMDCDSSALDGYQQGLFSLPAGEPLNETPCEGSPTDDRTSRRCRSKPNAKSSTGPVTCGWEGCTYTLPFTHVISLWRHIKDKHIFPDAFKCPSPQCGKAYGRKDKLQRHLRSHADAEGRGKCRSCHT